VRGMCGAGMPRGSGVLSTARRSVGVYGEVVFGVV